MDIQPHFIISKGIDNGTYQIRLELIEVRNLTWIVDIPYQQ